MLYLGYSNQAITPNQRVGVEKAMLALNIMEVRVKEFLEKDWTAFRALVESQDLSLFGDK